MAALIFNVLMPVLAVLCVIVALIFLGRALGARGRIGRQAYGVGQQEARRTMQLNFMRAIAAFAVGAVILGVWGLNLVAAEREPASTATPSPTTPSDTDFTAPAASPTITAVPLNPTQTPTVTPVVIPTATSSAPITATVTLTGPVTPPTATAVPVTATPDEDTATVNSAVGVWLRAEPNTGAEQLEWVLDGATLTLLPGYETGENFEWQQVRTPEGNEGWVAVEFITYNQ